MGWSSACSGRKSLWVVPVVVWLAPAAAGFQNVAQRVEFEVASIKPSPADAKGMRIVGWPPGTYTAENAPVRALIEDAYEVRSFQVINGPDWIAADRYHLTAKWRLDAPAQPATAATLAETEAEARAMLRALLEDRFKLKLHRETRDLPAYALRVTREGARLTPTTPGSCVAPGELGPDGKPAAVCGSSWTSRQGEYLVFEGAGLTMESVVRLLASAGNRTVVDETGLTGRYDMRLRWIPLPSAASPTADASASAGTLLPPGPVDPPVFRALEEQFGLRVQPTRARTEVIVVDAIERPTPD